MASQLRLIMTMQMRSYEVFEYVSSFFFFFWIGVVGMFQVQLIFCVLY